MKGKLVLASALVIMALMFSFVTISRTSAQSTSSSPPQGWFRVTLNGFHVMHETKDTALGLDGTFDEIRLMSTYFLINSSGAVVSQSSFKSKVICDGKFVDPDNLGTLTFPERRGLKAGDDFPAGSPAKLSLSARELEFHLSSPPVLLFEGLLSQGSRGVVIIPSIWEMDGSPELRTIYSEYLSSQARFMGSHVAEMITDYRFYGPRSGDFPVRQALKGGASMGLGEMAERVFIGTGILGLGDPKDRPIGMVKSGNHYTFVPKVLVLTFETADAIARTTGPYGSGVVKVYYEDDPDLAGQYELYLQVKRGTD